MDQGRQRRRASRALLVATAPTAAWAKAAGSRSSRVRERVEIDRLRAELSLLKEELEIKDARWARLQFPDELPLPAQLFMTWLVFVLWRRAARNN